MPDAATAVLRSPGQRLARASWIAFVAVWLLSAVLQSLAPVVADMLALLGAVAGGAMGVAALLRVKAEGAKGIVAPAIVGLLLNGLLVAIWLSNFLAQRARLGG